MSRHADHHRSGAEAGQRPRKAGAFDIRNFIGALLGIYGVVLVLAGLLDADDAAMAKTGGVNINLWAGLGLLASAAFFIGWARLRPVVVAAEPTGDEPPRGH